MNPLSSTSMLRAIAVGALLLFAAVDPVGSASARADGAFRIRSSLDGKTVLPHRIRWIAYPSSMVSFPGVEFLVDGKAVFANRIPPFAFGDDAKDETTGKVETGYLVTTWLSPGKHRFTVRARGQGTNRAITAERTVVARVLMPSAAPAGLTGTWQRQLTTPVPPDRNVLYRNVTAQPGTYRMTIDGPFIRIGGPTPRKHVKVDYVADRHTLTLRSPVWTGDPNEGAICEPWGPDAGYAWTVDGDTLTLAPSSPADTCKQRSAIVAGEWTRVR